MNATISVTEIEKIEEVPVQKQANEVMAKEVSKIENLEQDLEAVKEQHLQISNLLKSLGVKAMQTRDAKIYNFKDAMAAIKTGVELERQVRGMDAGDSAPVVNIIANQQSVIDKYTQDDGKED